jgi:tetratricopeptide (TPR) repeat protein
MSEKKKIKQQEEEKGFETIEETLSRTEQFIEKNQKILSYIVIGILVVVAGYMGVKKYYILPHRVEAQSQMFGAVNYFERDSFNLALNGDGSFLGFNDIIDEYGNTPAGNLAHYYAGISNLRLGNFDEAISQLQSFSSDDLIISTMALGAIGDAYSELNDNEEAVSYYVKAVENNPNDFTTPIFLFKAGLMYEILGDWENALKYYKRIETEYPKSKEARDIQKYITRARIKLGLPVNDEI